jgi:hypothetical protein
MICKGQGEEEQIRNALTSITPYVDGVYITLTGPTNTLKEVEKIIKSFERKDLPINLSYGNFQFEATQEIIDWVTKFLGYEPTMKVGDKIFEFDRARNFNLSQVPQDVYPWIVWMDSDDTFTGGDKLHYVADLAEVNNVEAIYFNYVYQAEFDEQGNIKHRIIEHLRERLLRNNGAYKWISPIHETLIEQRPTRKTDTKDCEVVHHATMASRMDSLTRNLKNLELAIYRTDGKDPRHTYYLAKAYFDLNTPEYNERAIPLLEQYLNGEHKSGWPEERQQACEYLSEIYRRQGKHTESVKACIRAFEEPCEPAPSVYINLALCFVMLQNWGLAMYWVKLATTMPDRQTTLVKNVKDMQGRVLEIVYNAQLNLHKIDEAWAAAKKMAELFPGEQTVMNALNFAEQLKTQRDLVVKVGELANYLTRSGEGAKIKPLLAAVPNIIAETPFIQDMYMKNNPPTPWGENEIAIFCGPGFTHWSSRKLDNPGTSFLGGSEEAVVCMAKALTDKGYKITVFGDPGDDEGEIAGVTWLPYYKFNVLDNFNILIVWRQLGLFDSPLKAKKTYMWCHDIQNPLEWTPERYNKMTKAIFLSHWQRENVPALPEEKVMISSNGI